MKRYDFENIGWTILAEVETNDCYINFKMYSISGAVASIAGVPPKPEERLIYEEKDANSGMDTVSNLEEAQVFMSGSLKWDGCSNVKFDEQDNSMLHFCGLSGWQNLAKAIEKLHELAVEIMPRADESLILS